MSPQRDTVAHPTDPSLARVNSFSRRPFSLEARVGIATPTGALGIAAEYSLLPQFALGCGIGTNLLGPEPACWARARLVTNRDTGYSFSLGASTARFEQNETTQNGIFGLFTGPLSAGSHSESPNSRLFTRAYWLNMDIGYEHRRGGYEWRMFAGGAGLMNPSDGVEHMSTNPNAVRADPPVDIVAYLGFGFGWAP